MMIAIATLTTNQSIHVRGRAIEVVFSPAIRDLVYSGSTPYRAPSLAAAFCHRRCSLRLTEDRAMTPAPTAITIDPPMTCANTEWDAPRSSPKTKIPHNSPHSWFVFESGIPRVIPVYLTAYC